MNPTRPDVVFDCNVYLQAITRANGPAAEAFRCVERNEVTLYVSRAILREVRKILTYPEIRRKNPHATDELIDSFLTRVAFRGVMIRVVPHVFDCPRDPADESYIDLVAAVAADFLVTRDNDLLCLMTDHSVEAKQFRQRFPALQILNPVGLLAALTGPRP